MNERIKELAEQAGFKYLPAVRLAFQGFNKEKFAELIVKDCALATLHHAAGVSKNSNGDVVTYCYTKELHKVLTEHFGMENEKYN